MSLRRIARSLDLSVTTVSRALGGFDDVAAATKRMVVAEAARINYRPNAAARRLRRGTSDAIGIVLPTGPGQLDDPFFLQLLGAVGPKLAAAGLDLIVGAARPGAEEEAFYRRLVENRRVDGMILARTRRDDPRVSYLLDAGLPFVIHGRADARRRHAYVDVDGAAAFRAATELFIEGGHRRIAMLSAPCHYSFAFHRLTGFRTAMKDAGLRHGPAPEAEPTEENGFLLAQALLRGGDRPTALLCATDRLAVGAIRAATQAGLQIGADIAIIGYDNLPVATYTDPPLTTFDPDVAGCAVRMVEMMLAQLGGADVADMAELRQATMIVRGSHGSAGIHPNDRLQGRRNAEETRHEPSQTGP